MPDVSLNGIEFVIKGSSDKASDSIDGLVSKLNELAEAISKAFNSAAFGGVGKKAKKETEPLDSALQDLIRNADKATQLKGKLDSLRDSLEGAFKAGNEKRAWSIQGQILSTEASLEKFDTTPLTQEMQDLISNASQIDILENKLLSLREAMQAAFEAGNADKAFGFRAQIIQTEAALEKARAAAEKTAPAIKEVGNSAKKATSPLSGFVASIKRIAMYRAIRAIIKSVTEAIKEGAENFYNFTKQSGGAFANYAKALDGVRAASSQMKNQLGAAFGTLYSQIAPIITSLISLVTRLANALTMVFSRIGGASGWYRATEAAAGAIDDVGGAAKEAIKYLAPFDELNRLPSNNGGGGGGSGADGGGYEWVDFEQYDIGDGLRDIVQWFTDAFNNIADWIENVDWIHLASTIVTEIGNAFSKVDWNGLAESIARFIGAALGAVSGFLVGALADLVTSISDGIYNAFHNDDGTLKTGQEIWNGICQGIMNAITGVVTWIKDHIVTPFVNGFKNAFGIASPAKEMIAPGEYVGLGILEGIKNVFDKIGDWLNEYLVQPFVDAIKGIPEKVADAWTLFQAWVKDIPAKMKQAGIDIINGFLEPVISGLNTWIDRWNSFVDTIQSAEWVPDWIKNSFGKIDPIEFQLIPDLPEGELTKFWDEAKRRLEEKAAAEQAQLEVTAEVDEFIDNIPEDTKRIAMDASLKRRMYANSQVEEELTKANMTAVLSSRVVEKNVTEPVTVLVNRKKNWTTSFPQWISGNSSGSVSGLYMSVGRKVNWTTPFTKWITSDSKGYLYGLYMAIGRKVNWTTPFPKWITSDSKGYLYGLYMAIGRKVNWTTPFTKWITSDSKGWLYGLSMAIGRVANWKDSFKKWATGNENGNITGIQAVVGRVLGWSTSIKEWIAGNKNGTVDGPSAMVSLIKSGWKTVAGWVQDKVGGNVTVPVTASAVTLNDSIPSKNKVIYVTVKAKRIDYEGSGVGSAATGGVLSHGAWSSIPQYASGGKPHGTMFFAGEAGPEIVGHVGGRTEVLNRSQLASTMYAAVKSAIASVGFRVSAVSPTTYGEEAVNEEAMYRAFKRALDETDFGGDVELDGETLYRAMVRRNRANTRMTGVNAMA